MIAFADSINWAQNIGFGIIALIMIFAALRVVTTTKVVHAALWLVVVLGGVAAQYILAASEFVAVSQVMVYIGAVAVLFLFGIMLTRAEVAGEADTDHHNWWIGAIVACGLLGVLGYVITRTYGTSVITEPTVEEVAGTTQAISDLYLGAYLVPLMAISFLLLAAAVGAIVLARRD